MNHYGVYTLPATCTEAWTEKICRKFPLEPRPKVIPTQSHNEYDYSTSSVLILIPKLVAVPMGIRTCTSLRVRGMKIDLQIILEPNSIVLGIGTGIGVRRCEHSISPCWTRYCLFHFPTSRPMYLVVLVAAN